MRLTLITTLALAAALLCGCKATVSTDVNYSQLFAPAAYVDSRLTIEIPSCTDRETGFDSSSLLEVKNRVPAVFPNAQYLGCRRVKFDTFAEFLVPVRVGKADAACAHTDICLFGNDSAHVYLSASEGFRQGFTRLSKGASATLEPVVQIRLSNDSGKPVQLGAISLFVDGKPFHYHVLTMSAGQGVNLQISDVAAQSVIAGNDTTLFFELKDQQN